MVMSAARRSAVQRVDGGVVPGICRLGRLRRNVRVMDNSRPRILASPPVFFEC